jgi:LEA14-like dessication related protein
MFAESAIKKITVLLLAGFLLVSCRDIKDVQFTGVRGFQVNNISTSGIDANILLGIKNPNGFGFSILPSEFSVMYSGISLGKARLQKRVKIKANSDETYSFKLKSDFTQTNVLDVLKLLNGSSFRNEVRLQGDLRAGKLLMRRKLPVDITESIRLK